MKVSILHESIKQKKTKGFFKSNVKRASGNFCVKYIHELLKKNEILWQNAQNLSDINFLGQFYSFEFFQNLHEKSLTIY